MRPVIPYIDNGVQDTKLHPYLHGFFKDVEILKHDNPEIQAFVCRHNTSEKGKTWRLAVYIACDVQGWRDSTRVNEIRWKRVIDVTKVQNWRGTWKVASWPVNKGPLVQAWFNTEAEAEEFVMRVWSMYEA